MAKTGRTTKETIAHLGFEAGLSSISIFGQEGNATTHHLASQGMVVHQ